MRFRRQIDPLPLLMQRVDRSVGATVKPMAAIDALGDQPERWHALPISDAPIMRPNYLYALPPQKLSAVAAVVRDELQRAGAQEPSCA